MKVSILDDYHDTLRHLPCFAKLAGHEVTIWNDHCQDLDPLSERLAETEALVKAAGAEPVVSETDVSSLEQLRALFATVDSRFGRLDVLFNNAGIGEGGTDWPDVPSERAAAIIDVNLRGVVLGTRLALEPMRRSGGGVIVNTASVAGITGVPGMSTYNASKFAVVGLTRNAAVEYGAAGIRVNCVCPGIIRTPMGEAAVSELGGAEALAAIGAAAHPLGRIGEPEELGGVAVFLASRAGSFASGHCFTIDGGQLIT